MIPRLVNETAHLGTTAGPSDATIVKNEDEEPTSTWILPLTPDTPTIWQRAVSEARQQAQEIDDEYSYAAHQTRTQKFRQLLAIRRIAHKHRVIAAYLRDKVLYESQRNPWRQDETSGLLEELTVQAAAAEPTRPACTVPTGPLLRNHKPAKAAVELAKEKNGSR